MEIKSTYELHRSTAVTLLLSVDKLANNYTNLRLAELLEEKFADKSKNRDYIVKEDDLQLGAKSIKSVKDF
jgi:hypothetical protein